MTSAASATSQARQRRLRARLVDQAGLIDAYQQTCKRVTAAEEQAATAAGNRVRAAAAQATIRRRRTERAVALVALARLVGDDELTGQLAGVAASQVRTARRAAGGLRGGRTVLSEEPPRPPKPTSTSIDTRSSVN